MTKKTREPLTKEQEADEIVRRLSAPPKKSIEYTEEELMELISEEIAREMDAEILKTLAPGPDIRIIKEEIDASTTSRIRRNW